VQNELDRIGAERHARNADRARGEPQGRREAREENQRLRDPAKLPAQKFLRRSNPLYKLAT